MVKLSDTFEAAKVKKVDPKLGLSFEAPHKFSEFYEMVHDSGTGEDLEFCVVAEIYASDRIKVTISSPLIVNGEYDWGYTVLHSSSCETEKEEKRIEWIGGEISKEDTTTALGDGSYVVRGSIYKVGQSSPHMQGTTKTPLVIA